MKCMGLGSYRCVLHGGDETLTQGVGESTSASPPMPGWFWCMRCARRRMELQHGLQEQQKGLGCSATPGVLVLKRSQSPAFKVHVPCWAPPLPCQGPQGSPDPILLTEQTAA